VSELSDRIWRARPNLPARSHLLHQEILKFLRDAVRSGHLRPPRGGVVEHVRLDSPRDKDEFVIIGGTKDFKRRRTSARLFRHDGAWLHFTMTLRQTDTAIELLGYNFELVYPPGHRPAWIRFDLNFEDHPNEIRSHLHPDNADIIVPAPVMTPTEILHLMLYGMQPSAGRHPRAPTDRMTPRQRARLLWSFRSRSTTNPPR